MNTPQTTITAPHEIIAIPAFSDNYIWLLRGSGDRRRRCLVVDPGDAKPVLAALAQYELELSHILLTHHHADHIGGVKRLKRRYSPQVYGPADWRMPWGIKVVGEGDGFDALGLQFSVLEVPGHTRSHIAYVAGDILFCGDTLFSAGCGRLFEGDARQMQDSLDKLAALPDHTQVYCTHEYTLSNCRFALEVEPENQALLARCAQVESLCQAGKNTLPSSIAAEKSFNPFMRTRHPAVAKAARKHNPNASQAHEIFAVIRNWKDRWIPSA